VISFACFTRVKFEGRGGHEGLPQERGQFSLLDSVTDLLCMWPCPLRLRHNFDPFHTLLIHSSTSSKSSFGFSIA
jgi:hypothetical protein